MATSVTTETAATASQLNPANLFELRCGSDTIGYTAHNFAGQRQLEYNGRTFVDDEIRVEETALGTLLTVELKAIPDLSRDVLTVVLPEVLVGKGGSEKVSLPVVFHTIQESIAGPPLTPGQVQTYDVKIFNGTASFVFS